MFKTLKSNAPSYLQEFFSIRETGYNLRDSEMRLNVLKPRTNYLSFCYSGALLWNSLPQEIRMLQTQAKFKEAVNKYYNNNNNNNNKFFISLIYKNFLHYYYLSCKTMSTDFPQ